MAPEQAQGRIDLIGPATDVYGLGDRALRDALRPAAVQGGIRVGDHPSDRHGAAATDPQTQAGLPARSWKRSA